MTFENKSYLRNRLMTLQTLSRLMFRKAKALQMLLYVRRQKLTFLGPGALADLALAVNAVERNEIPGILIEAGSALGGSAILIASVKKRERIFEVYDTFEMIPSPTDADGEDAHLRYDTIKHGKAKGFGQDSYYGYQDNLYERVQASFEGAGLATEKNHVRLVKGLVENTMNISQPVALAHIDCDWYSPVRTCLEQIVPCVSAGGRIIIDDYDQWSGARKAVDEYFADKSDQFAFKKLSRLHIIKKQPR